MLRSLLVFGLAGIGLRYALTDAFYALLLYVWIAYFRPEQWVWSDVVARLNLSLIAGFLLVGRAAMSGERVRLDSRTILVLLFVLHSLTSTMLSAHPDWTAWQNFAKCAVITVLIASL